MILTKDEDDYVCGIKGNDHYRLCKARAAHDSVLSKPNSFSEKKPVSTTAAPHLRTQDLITKLDNVAKVVDFDVPTILQEQLKDPVVSIVRSWIEESVSPDPSAPEIRQFNGLLRYGQELDRLLKEEYGQLLCFDEPSDKLDERNLRISLPLLLFLACFRLGHYNELGGHMGASKTYANAKRFYYWPGMFHCICALTADCLARENKKPKPKHLNEVPLDEWQGDTTPFCAIYIDHTGPIHPPGNRNTHWLLIVGSFSRFLIVYLVTNTAVQTTIVAVERWMLHFGIRQSLIHDRGTTFLITDFINWTKELGITLRPGTAHSTWTNGKVETQNQHIASYWRVFSNNAGTNWASLAPKFAFARNTSVNYTTGKTPYEIVFGTKPQIAMSVKLGLYRNKHMICCSEICTDLPPHTHHENSTKNELLQKLLRPQLSRILSNRGRDFKQIYFSTFQRRREKTARSHACRNRFKLGHHLHGQKFFLRKPAAKPIINQKLQQRPLGAFTVIKRVTSTTCQIQNDKDPSITKTVHRNHLVEYYSKEGSLPAMIEEHVPDYQRNDDDFYERFLEQRIGKLNIFTEPLAEDTIPFPIRPLPTAPAVTSRKRDSVTSSNSGNGSSQVFSSTLPITSEQLPQRPQETVTEQPSASAPTRPLTPFQQFLRYSRKSKAREPRYVKPQPHDPISQSVLRTLTCQRYKLY